MILGNGRLGKQLRNKLEASGIQVRAVFEIPQAGLEKLGQLAELIVCVDEIADLSEQLERIGESCKRNAIFSKKSLDVFLLSAKPNRRINDELIASVQSKYSLRIRVLSIPSLAARRLLRRYPLHLSADVVFEQTVHVLVVGFSELGKAIAVHAMRLAHFGLSNPWITIADAQLEHCRSEFLSEFPEAGSVAEFHFIDLDLSDFTPDVPVTSAYVCLTDGLDSELRIKPLLESLQHRQKACPPVFREIADFQISDNVSDWDGRVYPFSTLSEVCDPGVLLSDREDELARIVHDYYRDSIVAQGRSLDETPAGEPWESLDESYRQASRHQADHMPAKMAAIDCRFVAEGESEFFVFYPQEVEKLARIEHDRWSADRYLNGWKYGPVRDNDEKIHPELIAYDDLTEDMKDLDRYTVRLMPALLGRQGLAIKRNLIVAIVCRSKECTPGKSYIRSIDSVLKRLTERYPDQALVLAVDIGDQNQRILANRAREKYRVALWALICETLALVIEGAGSGQGKIECLELLACSERRICLAGTDEMKRWLHQRADIGLILGQLDKGNLIRCGLEMPIPDVDPMSGFTMPRQIRLDPKSGATGWSFEY